MKIIWTLTDESPRLASLTLLPLVQAFAALADVTVEARDISLSARILAQFPERLSPAQHRPDAMVELAQLTSSPRANIIKLPNMSASVPQIKAAIADLQAQGFNLPDYPDSIVTAEDRDVRRRYGKTKGSAVNPVLREGNSDRRAPHSVKSYARKHPHHMGRWSPDSKTRVATMNGDDFRANEKSWVAPADDLLTITFIDDTGGTRLLRDSVSVLAGEVVDASVLRAGPLRAFIEDQIQRAKEEDLLFSVHLKATMMKVSDPIIFGHVIRAFFPGVFDRHGAELAVAGYTPNHGLAALLSGLDALPNGAEISRAFQEGIDDGPALAMVDVGKGITNLHAPNDVIIDASMPAMIRTSGHMRGPDGLERDTLAVIPDSSYAGIYQKVIDDCRAHGAFNPATLGSVSNVGLMAQKAEEYGSHNKTFEMTGTGTVQVTNAAGEILLEHHVATGDIWRACQTTDVAIRDWVALAVTRARATGTPAVFWLDPTRAHDTALSEIVHAYLKGEDTDGLDVQVLPPEHAMEYSLERIRRGEDTISVTGNLLRDYLTDLFPIMELGTSSRMLSVVPLLSGGRVFETGAGGTAPTLTRAFEETGHFGWDSTGELLALAESLQFVADRTGNANAAILSETLSEAIEQLLDMGLTPASGHAVIDTRESHLHLASLWYLALRHTPIAARVAQSIPSAILSTLRQVSAAHSSATEHQWSGATLWNDGMRNS
ncbi:NADP-dependent isocitrate dehydrogenase [Microbacterium sp.]|uniref:NADP-dependent isocitrate dehydrogenase n=1 Tax=Microbacterium sp. TaxID=51671 RepID=UPI003F9E9D68